MRCEKCRKEITGIGKPAVPPAIPAILAWAGTIWAMWWLTMGENPLPGWTPISGWAVGLTTLAIATVLAWWGLVRRKCPECKSTRMLQAMEEESVLASERQAALEQATSGLRTAAERELQQNLSKSLRSEIEAEVRMSAVKEAAELRVRLEKQLRDEIGEELRAGQVKGERELRQRLASELRPEIEKELRPRLEERLRPEIEKELRPRLEEKLRPEIESELRPRLEETLRPEIEKELRPRLEEKLRPEIEKELRPRLEKELRPEIQKDLAASLPKPIQSEPEKAKPSVVESTPKPSVEGAKDLSKPELPVSVERPAPARATAPVSKAVTPGKPVNAGSSVAAAPSARPGFTTPAPSPTGLTSSKTPVPASSKTPALVSKTPVPASSKTPALVSKTPVPASSKTPALASMKPAASLSATTPSPVTPSPTTPAAKGADSATAAGGDKMAVTPGPVTDPRERAERRARVIVSDLSLYHKDILTKAAQSADPKKELGTLWRDAVLAYDRTVSPDLRSSTNYLEDELNKYLTQLRQNLTPPVGS